MRRKIVFLILILSFMMGCFNEKEENLIVNTKKGSEATTFLAAKDFEGIQIYLMSKKAEIIPSKGMLVITKESKEGILVSVVKENGKIKKEDELFKIKEEKDFLIEKVVENLEKIKTSRSNTTDKLLGDFNIDKKVDVLDLDLFIEKFDTALNDGKYDMKYDISPAIKGSGDWSDIYSISSSDGNIDLLDFIIFARNYGKNSPTETPYITKVEIVGNDLTLEEGKTEQLLVTVTLSNGESTTGGNINWSSSNTEVVTVNQEGVINAIKEGNAIITAEIEGEKGTKNITVKTETTEFKGLRILYKASSAPTIWMWEEEGRKISAELLGQTWPGAKMEESSNSGWYQVELSEDFAPFNKIIAMKFNEGNEVKLDLSNMQDNIVWYKDGSWNNENPEGPQAPTLNIDQKGGYFESTLTIEFNVEYDEGTTAKINKYTIDGSDPKINGIQFTNAKTIIIGNDMSDGDTKNLKIYTSATRIDNELLLEKEYSYVFRKGTQPENNLDILGATYSQESTTFKYWSPYSGNVSVWVNGQDYQCNKLSDENGYSNVYGVTVEGDLKNKTYTFKVDGNAVRDPYGKMVEDETLNFVVVDTNSIEPEGGWAPVPQLLEREDAIIYEVHVRDLSVDSTSGVSDNKKGKYMGLVETGTTYNGYTTGIDYLKELGVTHVQILPMADFPDGWGTYNWGYGSMNYNIPEDRYSMKDRRDYEGRIQEWQTMVNEFHKNGIRVIMDVVYNHTPSGGTLPGYYYHSGSGLAGCGNSIDVGKDPMISRWVQDSLEYLVTTYGFDGFRFDLIGVHEYEEVGKWSRNLNNKFPDRNILFYGEPWNGYATDEKEDQKVRLDKLHLIEDAHVGAFNDQFRNSVKGEGDHPEMGYMFNWRSPAIGKTDEDVAIGIRGSVDQFASDPEQTINYLTAHDNFALWDKIKFSAQYDIDYLYAKRISMFGYGTILTSQGIPFIHGGEEMLRTKSPDGNMSWDNKISDETFEVIKNTNDGSKGGDNVNKFRWNWRIDNKDVVDYYKGLIKMRREHPGFRMNTKAEIESNVHTSTKGNGVIVTKINGAANGDSWENIIIVHNSSDDYSLSLDGTWKVAVSGTNSNVGGTSVTGTYTCEGTSVTVLYQD